MLFHDEATKRQICSQKYWSDCQDFGEIQSGSAQQDVRFRFKTNRRQSALQTIVFFFQEAPKQAAKARNCYALIDLD